MAMEGPQRQFGLAIELANHGWGMLEGAMTRVAPQRALNFYNEVQQEVNQGEEGAAQQAQHENQLPSWERAIGEKAGQIAGWGLGLSLGAIIGLLAGAYKGYCTGQKIGEEKGAQFSATAVALVGGGLGYLVNQVSDSDYPLALMGITTLAMTYLVGSKVQTAFKGLGGMVGTVCAIGTEGVRGFVKHGKESSETWMNRGAYMGRFGTVLGARIGQAVGEVAASTFSRNPNFQAFGSFVGRITVPLVAAAISEYMTASSLGLADLLIASFAIELTQRTLKKGLFKIFQPGQPKKLNWAANLAGMILGGSLFCFNVLDGGPAGSCIRFGAKMLGTGYSTLVWNGGAIPLAGAGMALSVSKAFLSAVRANLPIAIFSVMLGCTFFSQFVATKPEKQPPMPGAPATEAAAPTPAAPVQQGDAQERFFTPESAAAAE